MEAGVFMSEEDSHELHDRLKSIDIMAKAVWALIVGAFGIGVWAATMQSTLNEHEARGLTNQARIRDLEIMQAADTEKLKAILQTLERIELKLEK